MTLASWRNGRAVACIRLGYRDAGDEARNCFQRRFGLIAKRAVAAMLKLDQLAGTLCLERNRAQLRHGAVLVVASLDREHRTGHARQVLLNVPVEELGIEPDIVPQVERAPRIAMIPAKPLRQVGRL